MPGWLKIVLNMIMFLIPEILKGKSVPSNCPNQEQKDGDKEKK
jgi:hypothetical protein